MRDKLGWLTRFELAAFGATDRRSNQLSYNHHATAFATRTRAFEFHLEPALVHPASNGGTVQNGPFIVEAAINGTVTNAKNPHVPLTASEVAACVDACIAAGASVFHSHAREANLV